MHSIIDDGLRIEQYTKAEKLALRERFPHLRIGIAKFGLGVFSTIFIPEGTFVGRVTGVYVLDRTYGSNYCMVVDPYGVMEPDPPLRYVNHSCDPNCQIVSVPAVDDAGNPALGQVWFQAVRDIDLGSELSIDYSWSGGDQIVPCKCGSKNCRGWIASPKEAACRNKSK